MPFYGLVVAACAREQFGEGLTLAFSTPIFRHQLEASDSARLAQVALAIKEVWAAHKRNSTRQTDRTVSDTFFAEQRNGFQAGGRHLLARLEGDAGDALRDWHAKWKAAIVRYVEAASGPDAMSSLMRRPLSIFAWASVHERCSRHDSHFHPDAAVSGTFYLETSADGGSFFAEDPRGPRPPFEQVLRHTPQPGEVLLFPPWMRHGVETVGACSAEELMAAGAGAQRVAISFNLGPRPQGATTCADGVAEAGDKDLWDVLSEANVYLGDVMGEDSGGSVESSHES
jgi:hypothetical protein